MLKACQYCGRIHDKKFDCGKKPQREYKHYRKSYDPTEADRFRSSALWKKKVQQIKERDQYLCQAYLHDLLGIGNVLISEGLQVHHIIPLEEDFSLRLDDNNLITLNSLPHDLAERGAIGRDTLRKIAEENNKK